MSAPEVLGGGGDRRPGRPARRRRLWTVGGTALVIAAVVTLAVRANPEPSAPAATPTPSSTAPRPSPTGPPPVVVGTAVGTRWAYALLATCTFPDQLVDCTTRLHRRSLGGGDWTAAGWRSRRTDGPAAQLHVTGDDQVTVVDEPTAGQVHASTDGGRTAQVHRLRPGPPVAQVPPGGVLDLGLCEACSGRLTVLEPATGRLRPLATQPSFGRTAGIRALATSGDRVWVLAQSGELGRDMVTAVSTDRGRSWRALPLPGSAATAMVVRIFSDGAAGAYVLVGEDRRPDVLNEFSALWRIGDPAAGAAWQRITPDRRPPSAVTLVPGERGVLITTEDGGAWRLEPDTGVIGELPPADYGGVPLKPGTVVTGPGRAFLALPEAQSDLPRPTLLLSFDEGETWRVEEIS